MGDLSKNFSRHEFKCNCGECDYDTVDAQLIRELQKLRDTFGKPVRITSANRCPEYNKKVGGSPKSQHLRGRAVDIQVVGVLPDKVAEWFEENVSGGGIGRYNTFTHRDTRTGTARWDLRT